MHRYLVPTASVLLVGLAAIPPAVTAAEITREEYILPVNVCQGALPSYEGAFRKRPRGIRNEGSGDAFISCALLARAGSVAKHTNINIKFYNSSAVARTISCTLVDGGGIGGSAPAPINIVKSGNMPAGNAAFLSWSTSDNGGDNYYVPAFSCLIPPGVEINNVNDTYREEIGS